MRIIGYIWWNQLSSHWYGKQVAYSTMTLYESIIPNDKHLYIVYSRV